MFLEFALTSLTLFDAYRSNASHAQLLTSKSRPRIEYLLRSDKIIVLDR